MNVSRLIGFSALAGAAACAHSAPNTAAKPREGPKASIHAMYNGGLLNRQVDAQFRVEQTSYVMVAHLGGDGRIQIIYPEDGRETGLVPGGKWFRTNTISALYDAMPQLYSFTMATRYRPFSTRLDSYDGLGYGFVFMVASKRPLRFDQISSYGDWDEYEIDDFQNRSDPRDAINAFAAMLAGGADYTLKFAQNFGTVGFTSYADQMFDCAYLSTFGLSSFGSSLFYNFGFMGLDSPFRYARGCGRAYDPFASLSPFRTALGPTNGNPNTPRPGTTLNDWRRRGSRSLGSAGPALGFNRPMFNPTTTSTSTLDVAPLAPRGRRGFGTSAGDFGSRTDFGGRTGSRARNTFGPGVSRRSSDGPQVYDAPRGMRPTAHTSGSTESVRPMTPAASAPRAQPVQTTAPARTPAAEVKGNPEAKKP